MGVPSQTSLTRVRYIRQLNANNEISSHCSPIVADCGHIAGKNQSEMTCAGDDAIAHPIHLLVEIKIEASLA